MTCEHLEEISNVSEYMGRSVTELIYTCSLGCDHECEDCDGEGNLKGDEDEDIK